MWTARNDQIKVAFQNQFLPFNSFNENECENDLFYELLIR